MTERPWWWPIREALVKKAAELIDQVQIGPPPEADKPLILDVEAEDVPRPAKALPTRAKGRRRALTDEDAREFMVEEKGKGPA